MEPNPGMFFRVGSDADDDEPDSLVGGASRSCAVNVRVHRFRFSLI